MVKIILAATVLSFPTVVLAQGTYVAPNTGYSQQQYRQGTVQTQPSNNPFVNPIGQGVPPAAQLQRRVQPRKSGYHN